MTVPSEVEIIEGAAAIDEWSVEALQAAAIEELATRNYELFRSFIKSLGEVALRVNLEIELDGDR